MIVVATGASEPGGELSANGVLLATLWQDLLFIAVPLLLALSLRHVPPRAADFGLVRITGRRLAAAVALGAAVFYGASWVYGLLISDGGSQDTLERLGAERGGAGLVAAAVMVVVIAPVVEEFFFRGFVYRAARNGLGPAGAALFVGVLFGAVHLGDPDVLPLIPLLALLGALMCVLYERTGSLAAPIALHVVNNMLAFSFAADLDAPEAVGLPLGALTLLTVWLVATKGVRSSPREGEGPIPASARV
ncbi:CPBP family intramembrane metalloprotease [Conexibacter sp. W3-3-2]|uniref:CPBP family intramembrane glutamic endopeptidase n=1 Tax=Conexibacter sp. W3-3-2 TaxID=2675227 RepID=UPI0012B8DEE5|nr:type II CAAX endopeptidase family protein [Conexibacter sp. W3-3-2]MTD47486.1 CPBP family intramembrane metalloprotease [Conexibacter sp. W3-3-2]